jgi:S-adenosylmethionine/arginine decarboxylase-like enzyme
MTRYKEPIIWRFGEDESIYGITFFQAIQESNISGHLVESSKEAYIDVFSCKPFDKKLASNYTKVFFKAKRIKVKYEKRCASRWSLLDYLLNIL